MSRNSLRQVTTLDGYGSLGLVIDRHDLHTLPKPVPMIESWLDTRTAVLMVGATGTNKTFALIGWACSVATGHSWLGHKVTIEPTPVIYVVGEGASGFDARISAWELDAGLEVGRGRVVCVLMPESLTDEDFWTDLYRLTRDLGARLIILDTFSSLAPDADEMKDAAALLRRMSGLATEIDGAVLLAHHTGWGPQDRARGGSQLEANPDSVIVLQKTDPDDVNCVVSVTRKKDKDGPSGKRIHVQRLVVDASCVLVATDEPPSAKGQGEQATDAEIALSIIAFIEANPDQTQNEIVTGVMKECGAGKPRVTKQFQQLKADGRITTERRQRPESGRPVSRAVWDVAPEKVSLKHAREGSMEPPDPTRSVSGRVGRAGRGSPNSVRNSVQPATRKVRKS